VQAWQVSRAAKVRVGDPSRTLNFIKNLIVTGGLLQIVASGAGAISIDNQHSKDRARPGDEAVTPAQKTSTAHGQAAPRYIG
jgi:hypothetical protein